MDERSAYFAAARGDLRADRDPARPEAGALTASQRRRFEGWLQSHNTLIDWASTDSDSLSSEDAVLPPRFLEPSELPGSMGRLNQYEVVQIVAGDESGVVLEAFDTSLDRVVAIKVAHTKQGFSPEARTRFLESAKALATILHPSLTRILDVGERRQTPYAVWECAGGRSLSGRTAKGDRSSPDQLRRLGLRIAEGLWVLHTAGLTHHAITARNVLCSDDHDLVKVSTLCMVGRANTASVGELAASCGERSRCTEDGCRADLTGLGNLLSALAGDQPSGCLDETIARLRGDDPHGGIQSAAEACRVLETQRRDLGGDIDAPVRSRRRRRYRPIAWFRRPSALARAGAAVLALVTLLTAAASAWLPRIEQHEGHGNLTIRASDPRALFVIEGVTSRDGRPMLLVDKGTVFLPFPPGDYSFRGFVDDILICKEEFQIEGGEDLKFNISGGSGPDSPIAPVQANTITSDESVARANARTTYPSVPIRLPLVQGAPNARTLD